MKKRGKITGIKILILFIVFLSAFQMSNIFIFNNNIFQGNDILKKVETIQEYKLRYVGGLYGAGTPLFLDGVQELKNHGTYLYVSSLLDNRLTILSVEENRSTPVFISSVDVGAAPRKLSISSDGNWVFLGTQIHNNTGSGSLLIINVTDKSTPKICSELIVDPDGMIIGCYYVESVEICYIASYSENKIYSIDVSDKLNPYIVSYFEVGDGPHGIWANESVAFILGHFDRMVHTIDVSNPEKMTYLDGFYSKYLHRCSQLFGEYSPTIYVASLNKSICIFDISNPRKITRLSEITFIDEFVCSAIPNKDEKFLFITYSNTDSHRGKLYVYDIENKSTPKLVNLIKDLGSIPLKDPAAGAIAVINDFIYVGLWDYDGISVFKLDYSEKFINIIR